MRSIGTAMFSAAMLGADSLAWFRTKRYWSRLAKRLIQSRFNWTWLAAIMTLTFILVSCSQEERTATPRVVDAITAPEPTVLPPTPATEPGGATISFIDSGQRLGSAQSWDVALGDLDGDGDLDAFVANSVQGGANNAVWLNNGQSSFTLSEQSLGFGQGVALGDLDGDGDLDTVVTHWWGEEYSTVWLNDGSGAFADSGQNLGFAFRPALGDLDGDGDLDIFLAQMEANSVWLNDGRGAFTDTGQRLGTAVTADVALDDLDGDGDLDALAGGWDEAAKVWLNDGLGTFTEHNQSLPLASVHIHDLALGDVDGDGDLDAFMAVASGDPNQVWLNDGAGAFSDSGQRLLSSLAHGVSLGDVDGDGDLDALTAHGDRYKGLFGGNLWLNDGRGHFTDSNLSLGDLYSSGVALGDLDGDGDLDAFMTNGEQWQEDGGELPNLVWLNETISLAASTAIPPITLPHGEGGEIAFYSDRDGNDEIYTMNSDGGDQLRLTFNQFIDHSPAWSPDGRQIAFLSDRDDPQPGTCNPDCLFQIYVINADGSEEHKLAETELTAFHPDWHPDGSRLSFDTQFDLQGDIYVVNADGSDLQLLIQDGFWADWSPDGTQIVFASNRDGNVEIYTADADGSDQRRLTDNTRFEFFPAWSPDGQRIAFATVQQKQIFVMNSDGSDEQQLTELGLSENPAWSPDGTQIVFQSSRDGNFEIYTLSVQATLEGADGSATRRLTNNSAGDFWSAWRPSLSSQETPLPTSSIYAPQGIPATIDGVFSPGEWDNALTIDLANGELLLMHAGGYLYLGIDSDNLGLGSVCVRRDDEISILHSSAALGTATYVKAGEEWLKTRDFSWTNRDISTGQQALEERSEHLERENWLASNGLMGSSNEMEYQFAMTDDQIHLAVTYLMSPDYTSTDFWPDTLGAGCRNFEPLPGDPPETVYFAPETWITVIASHE